MEIPLFILVVLLLATNLITVRRLRKEQAVKLKTPHHSEDTRLIKKLRTDLKASNSLLTEAQEKIKRVTDLCKQKRELVLQVNERNLVLEESRDKYEKKSLKLMEEKAEFETRLKANSKLLISSNKLAESLKNDRDSYQLENKSLKKDLASHTATLN